MEEEDEEEEEEKVALYMENGNFVDEERPDNDLLLHQEDSEGWTAGKLTKNDLGRSLPNGEVIDWRAPAIILGFQCLESLALYGICTNLVIYLRNILHESNTSAAASVTNWTGTSFFAPFLGALIADSYWGSYRTILVSSFIYFLGMLIVTLSASLTSLKPPPCNGNFYSPATELHKFVFYSGLYLIAFGSGGVKASLLPLGADQFDDDNHVQREKRGSFFNWFYFCNNVGALISGTLIVWVQENVSWPLGYSIATLCLALAIASFIYGTPSYRLREPRESPLVVLASLWKSDVSVHPKVEDTKLNSDEAHLLVHSDEFRVPAGSVEADVNKQKRSCSCIVPEELKIYQQLFPIWLTSIVYSVAYAQMDTTFVEQGKAMDTNLGSFSIPPASLSAFEVLSIMLWVLLYDMVFVARVKRLSQLQRMGVGHFFMIVAMSAAAVLEAERLRGVGKEKPVSILWQLLQYFVVGGSEVFCYIGQLEFFYDQGPDALRSVSTAISLLTISLGNYLSSLVVALVALATSEGERPGWIADDLNEGHLDYFFWLLAGLCLLNFMCYFACAKSYILKKE